VWVYARLKVLPIQDAHQYVERAYIAGEYGGMNEVMARLFRLAGDRQFLECAKLFDNINVFYANADRARTAWPRTSIRSAASTPTSISRRSPGPWNYSATRWNCPITGSADNFWNIVTNSYMYSIGRRRRRPAIRTTRMLHGRARHAVGERIRDAVRTKPAAPTIS